MSQRIARYLTLPVLLFTLVLASCEQAGGPDSLLAPQLSETTALKMVEGNDGEGLVARTYIGSGGGTILIHGGHKLVVPAGAVSSLTVFEVTLYPTYIAADLTATKYGSTTKNDVGSAGFAKPVTLTLSWEYATRAVDTSKVTIAYDSSTGLQAVTSKVDTSAKKVTADLSHFSGYAVSD